MNTTVLKKIESAWVRLDWSEWVRRMPLSNKDLEQMLDIVDNFKTNRRAKELALCKFRFMPAYVCVLRTEFKLFLEWLYSECIKREMYEECQRIMDIRIKLNYDKV